MVTIKVTGLDRVLAAFSKIPKATKRIGRVAVKESLQIVEEHSSKNHKYKARTGNADKAYKTVMDSSGLSGTLTLDPKISNAPYVIPLHQGHKAYTVNRKFKKAIYFVKGGKEFFAKKVNIPAAPGEPFLYNAAKAKTKEVVAIMRTAVNRIIKEAGF